MLDESPTSVNLGNDHEFIIKEYSQHWLMPFGQAQSKIIRAYAQSGQYHTIVESCVYLTSSSYSIIKNSRLLKLVYA